MSGKDYIAQIKIRNGPMLRAMRRLKHPGREREMRGLA